MSDPAVEKNKLGKPEKPDEELYNANLKTAEREYTEAKAKFDLARVKCSDAQPKSKDSPAAKRRQELATELIELRQKHGSSRNQTFEQIKKLDEQLKARQTEQKTARSRVAFKNVDEIDREIDRLEKQVNGGMMKLVDERKALDEISRLRKQRKSFAGFDESQKAIDDLKAKRESLRSSLEDPKAKALNERISKVQEELNIIKAEQDEAYQNMSSLRERRDKYYAEQQEKYLVLKKIKDDYYYAKKSYQAYEQEVWRKAKERQRTEREAIEREKRRERAEKMLAEARDPAYLDEIRRAESLLRYLDPSNPTNTVAPLLPPSGLSATAQRTIDASDIKGTRVIRKDEREDSYFMGTGGKKGKRGRKIAVDAGASTVTPGKFRLPPSIVEDCNAMGIDPPMGPAEVPSVVEKVKTKLSHWKADQKAQTDKNVAKALKEIERLDEAADSTPPTPTANGHTNETDTGESEKTKAEVSGIVAAAGAIGIDDKE